MTLAMVAWGAAVVAGIMMVAHRKPGIGIGRLIFSGIAWFHADHFTAAGQPYRRAFVAAFVTFMVLVLVIAVSGLFIAR